MVADVVRFEESKNWAVQVAQQLSFSLDQSRRAAAAAVEEVELHLVI